MGKVVFQCEDSTDGIFTGIYDAWDSRVGHRNVKLEAGREYLWNLNRSTVLIPVNTKVQDWVCHW